MIVQAQISGIRAVETSGFRRVGTLGDTCGCCYIMHWSHACRRLLECVCKSGACFLESVAMHVPSRPNNEGKKRMIRKPLHAVILLLSNRVPMLLHPKTSFNLILSRLQAQLHGTSFGFWRADETGLLHRRTVTE